jgi:hypothetical protein
MVPKRARWLRSCRGKLDGTVLLACCVTQVERGGTARGGPRLFTKWQPASCGWRPPIEPICRLLREGGGPYGFRQLIDRRAIDIVQTDLPGRAGDFRVPQSPHPAVEGSDRGSPRSDGSPECWVPSCSVGAGARCRPTGTTIHGARAGWTPQRIGNERQSGFALCVLSTCRRSILLAR